MEKSLSQFKKIVDNTERLVAFTGAGLSNESGISTYRGAGGLWSKYDPSIYADINYFLKDSSYYWNFFREIRYPMIKNAQPNKAHYVLVQLEQQGKLKHLITQNIDGLHQLAGQKKVIELHGNTRRIKCMDCGQMMSMDEAYKRLADELPPRCLCGGRLRPDTIMFGEPLPQHALHDAENAARACDTFLVLGSSLVVYPAAQIPIRAKQNNAAVVIVNIDETPLDSLADMVINKKASEALSILLNQ